MAFARTIIEDKQVSQLLDDAIRNEPRLGELFEGLKWRLAREPDAGYPVPGTDLRVIRSSEWPMIKGVIVLAYTYTENEIVLIGARTEGAQAMPSVKLA